VCIFYSSIIYHKVAKFQPSMQTEEQAQQKITPGRIGSVFFFPTASYEILRNKKPGWASRTAFGKNEKLVEENFKMETGE